MNLSPSDEDRMIRESAESLLADASDSAAVRRVMAGEPGYDAALWIRIAGELGWCGIGVDEDHGGLGGGLMARMLVLEVLGRTLACVPFAAHAGLATPLLAELGHAEARARWLPGFATGAVTATVPLPATPSWPAGCAVQARRQGAGWQLDGSAARVPDAQAASHLLVFATLEGMGGTALFVVPRAAAGVGVEPIPGWDGTRRFSRLVLAGTVLPAGARVDDPARAGRLGRATALAQLALAAEALGGAQACLDLTVAYTTTRRQFGRSIAGFQAVKHRCAAMMVAVEALRSMVQGAAALASAPDADGATLACECASAKAQAAETYFHCAQEAIQLHGGVGFTWEYDPQLHFKRAQALRHWLGTPEALREDIARTLFDPERAAA